MGEIVQLRRRTDPYAAPAAAQREADARRRQTTVFRELRNALARAVKGADQEGWIAPVITLRIKR